MRGATVAPYGSLAFYTFQPTRPLRGATGYTADETAEAYISTHAPLAGRDVCAFTCVFCMAISTHAPLAGRDNNRRKNIHEILISTHAPLAGRDRLAPALGQIRNNISTHAPLAGRDALTWIVLISSIVFQPTRPLRGATLSFPWLNVNTIYFNPRAPCGARLDFR